MWKIEENNKKGRTRDLYKEIKDITGSYTARCGVMNLSSGNTATEEKEVNIRWNNTQKSSTGEILKSLILSPKHDMKMNLIYQKQR